VKLIIARSGSTIALEHRCLRNDPEFYSVSEANSRAFGTGQLDLPVIEQIPTRGLVFDQLVRFDNLNAPRVTTPFTSDSPVGFMTFF
jgi:hypothetical protein